MSALHVVTVIKGDVDANNLDLHVTIDGASPSLAVLHSRWRSSISALLILFVRQMTIAFLSWPAFSPALRSTGGGGFSIRIGAPQDRLRALATI
ncbi:MAG: hypothetical protein INR71_04195 [Terriglobus roseus]|nr:hypothetical protein [Terriglobus roseus]